MFPIYDKLGGEAATIQELRARGRKPGWPSVYARKLWRVNRKLPGTVVTLLMEACDERGIPYTKSDFEAPPKEAAA